jgi:BirA family biotin operon repressor/biotin-[acetyl-CoA-carboxylase] ligase
MPALEMPPVLNRIAMAGPAGLAIDDDQAALDQIEICRAWGYDIQVRTARAILMHESDCVVPICVEREVESLAWGITRVHGYFEIGSTNDQALMEARAGCPEGTLIYAERQTAGRGRLGRTWISRAGSGLYFSLVLRPGRPIQFWPILNHVAAVALCRALEDLPHLDAALPKLEIDLKWPNDVLLSGKKTAGILLESVQSGDTHEAAVVGVGINVAPDAVPMDLRDRATSIVAQTGAPVPRRWLLVRFLNHFQRLYKLFSAGAYGTIIETWKSLSTMWNGVEITLTEGGRISTAVTCGLTETGALRIRSASGREETVLAGDVSIRRR